jgi:hypothetical protein
VPADHGVAGTVPDFFQNSPGELVGSGGVYYVRIVDADNNQGFDPDVSAGSAAGGDMSIRGK